MSQQSLRQASIRAVTSTTYTYEGDWHALWDLLGIAAGQFNERMLAYINNQLSTSYTEVNGAMAAFAAANGSTTFQAIGTFTPGFSLDAPVLAFASATNPSNDNTQDFDAIFFESIEGRTLRLVGTEGSATVGAFDIDVSNAIDAAEDLASEASFTTGAIADGVCSFKCRIEDGSGNALSDWSNTVSKTIDTTAPTLSSPVDTAATSTTGTGSVSTDEGNGTLYWVVSTSSTPPSAAQVKAGQMHTGAAAADSGSQAVSGTGVQNITGDFTGLTASTAYTAHYMHEDAAANQSSVSSGDGFTTAADAPTFERTAALNFVGSGTSHTFSATDIGDASATKVLLIFAFCAGAATTVSSLTVGGNAATLLTGTNLSSSGVGSSAFKIEIASGDPEDIAVTWNATVSSMGIIVYALDGVDPTETARVSSAAFGASDVNTITVPTDGFAISGSLLQNSTAEGVWSNCTEDGTRVFIAGGTGVPMQSAHTTTAGSQSPTIDPTGSDIIIHHTIAFGP